MNISCMPWFFFFKEKQKKHKAYICHNIDDLVLSGESLEVWGDERRDQGCVANPPPTVWSLHCECVFVCDRLTGSAV